jgi:uncharacterized protein with PIN domain
VEPARKFLVERPVVRYNSIMPKCPYCKQVVTLERTRRDSADVSVPEEVEREVSGVIKKEIMYSCPHCDSILGFGFFFGGLLTGRP